MGSLGTESRLVDVVVVDDHASFADAISLAIDLQPDLRCLATVGTAEAAVELAQRECPDVVLLDLALPGMGGIEALPVLRAACPDLRIVVLTANTSSDALLAAVDAGADGFLPKEQPFADVLDVIRRGDEAPGATSMAMAQILKQAAPVPSAVGPAPAPVSLTEREREVLELLADGLVVKQIAARLGISVNTCRGHIRTLLAKFDAHSQLAAVVTAARQGLLPNLRTVNG